MFANNFITVAIPTMMSFLTYVTADCMPPCLYVTNISSVFRLPLNSTNGLLRHKQPEILFQTDGHIRSIELDSKNDHIFWGDFKRNSIHRSALNGSSRTPLFTYAIGYPQGLAVDWSSNILYWTDNLMKMIELSDTNGRNRKVLFTFSGDDEPRGLCVNPVAGYLFWTDWGSRARIERSSLSGQNRKTIVKSRIKWPNDLAIDYQNNRLFWVDAYLDSIESVDFDGRDRKLEHALKSSSIHPYGLAFSIDKNIAYLTDWQKDALVAVGGDIKGTRILFQNPIRHRNIGQVRIREEDAIKNASSPCLQSVYQCSHLCLKSGENSYVCDCPTGMKLKTSRIHCEAISKEYEIYFADSHLIGIYHLTKYVNEEGFNIRQIDMPSHIKLSYPVALDFDSIENKIYWTDRKTNKTFRMNASGSRPEEILHTKDRASFGIAVDKTSRLLYWFGDNGKSLKVSSLDGRYTKTLLKNFFIYPRDITLHEEKGYLYFTDYSLQVLGRLNRDGTGLKIFTGDKKTVSATGLAIDKVENRLYWCDTDSYSIESSDLNFENTKKIVQKTVFARNRFWLLEKYGHVVAPFSIAVSGEKIFWTELYKEAIFEADKRSGGNIKYVTSGLNHPRDLHVLKGDQPVKNNRLIYKFSFIRRALRPKQAYCYITSSCSSSFTGRNYIPDPDMCPPGYKETRSAKVCANCSDAFGANFKCECKDWKTCAQRAYGDVIGCHPKRPFISFKVRECKQVVKPGYCPYQNIYKCDENAKKCLADEDCLGTSKCCKSLCGMKCTASSVKKPHPCSSPNKGGCSHMCFAKENSYRCACPDDMILGTNGKICLDKDDTFITPDPCAQPLHVGACHPVERVKRWYFNPTTNECQQFNYGRCGGNKNNFLTKDHCENKCSAKHPSLNKCFQPMAVGACQARLKKWYFDFGTKTCKQFFYGGCQGNENRFNNEVSCYKSCAHVVCSQPAATGVCRMHTKHYHYNPKSQKCEQFVYGGCGGNENNFKDEYSCTQYCINDDPDACHSSPCKNGASCTPVGQYGSEYNCTCKADWIGKSCDLNAGTGKVYVKFAKITSKSKKITTEEFQKLLAGYFTIFCALNNDKCVFNTKLTHTRVRRLSVYLHWKFLPDNIHITNFNDKEQTVDFHLIIIQPSITLQSGEQTGYLTQNSVNEGFKKYGNEIGKIFGMQFLGIKESGQLSQPRETSKKRTQKSLLVVTILLIIFILVVAAVYYIWKRYYKNKQLLNRTTSNPTEQVTTNTTTENAVSWTFENQLYNDLYPQNVTLPGYDETPETADPASKLQDAATAEDISVNLDSEKKENTEWVKFDEEAKVPISDFVTARLSDPYAVEDDLYEPPPDYTSQIGTPTLPRIEFSETLSQGEVIIKPYPHDDSQMDVSLSKDLTFGSDDMNIPDISTDELIMAPSQQERHTKILDNIPMEDETI